MMLPVTVPYAGNLIKSKRKISEVIDYLCGLAKMLPHKQFGPVAQLVRVPDCRSGGCGFESRRGRLRSLGDTSDEFE